MSGFRRQSRLISNNQTRVIHSNDLLALQQAHQARDRLTGGADRLRNLLVSELDLQTNPSFSLFPHLLKPAE